MSELKPLTVEERWRNLDFLRVEPKNGDDTEFTTTLLMQEQWLATIDALQAALGTTQGDLEKMRTHHALHCNCGSTVDSVLHSKETG